MRATQKVWLIDVGEIFWKKIGRVFLQNIWGICGSETRQKTGFEF
jgi:hypothetical protein